MRILDLGCGTAEILGALPTDITYVGYDMSPEYIAAAQNRFAGRGTFHCRLLEQAEVAALEPFDLVLGIGVLHHLDDAARSSWRAKAALMGWRIYLTLLCVGQTPSRLPHIAGSGQHVRDVEAIALYESGCRVTSTLVPGLIRARVDMECRMSAVVTRQGPVVPIGRLIVRGQDVCNEGSRRSSCGRWRLALLSPDSGCSRGSTSTTTCLFCAFLGCQGESWASSGRNLPMVWGLFVPSASCSRTWRTTVRRAVVFWAYFLIGTTLICVLSRLDSRDRAASAGGRHIRSRATLAPGFSFGQREHACVLFGMPYLAAAVLRLQGGQISRKSLATCIGVLAGIGFALKPHFLAVPALVELLLLARFGWRSLLVRVEPRARAHGALAIGGGSSHSDYLKFTINGPLHTGHTT
jgi:hypothetical protein